MKAIDIVWNWDGKEASLEAVRRLPKSMHIPDDVYEKDLNGDRTAIHNYLLKETGFITSCSCYNIVENDYPEIKCTDFRVIVNLMPQTEVPGDEYFADVEGFNDSTNSWENIYTSAWHSTIQEAFNDAIRWYKTEARKFS